VSIINKMLQELDRRHARPTPPGQAPHPEVRAVHAMRAKQEWFWRVVAGLMLAAAAWTLWVVYQLQPRSVATELAYRAAENSRRAASSAPLPPTATATALPASAPMASPSAGEAPKPPPEKLAVSMESLRLALAIDTPLAPRPPKAQRASPAPSSAAAKSTQRVMSASAKPEPAPARIEKLARDGSPAERAESLFRRAAQLLERGRVSDAEEALAGALETDHAHRPARQTLIALLIEQGRIEEARRLLQEGVALEPTHTPYAVALARIYVDRGDFPLALEVLDKAGAGAAPNDDYHVMRGAILLKLSRPGEAADAYRLALGSGKQSGASWVGLGVSLDALGEKPEAAEAFRRGVATGGLAEELKAYAEQRLRQLQ
jgi:tetratricopeptide (TPR) repeat protein